MQRTAVAVLTMLPEGSYPPGLATRVAELRTKQMEVDELVAQQEAPLRVAIGQRDQALGAMIDATAVITGLALGHARANGLTTLANQLATSGLTPAMLDDLDAKIVAATAALVVPRDAVVTRRAATERLPIVLREIDQILRTGVDPLIYGMRNTHPDFYARYRAAREIVDRPASRMSGNEQEAASASTAARPVIATAQAQPLAA